jgi:UDP-N-acetylglucosamine acyltransferase
MTHHIHPTAIVAPGARLGSGVQVGPYAVIEDNTEIGDGCLIDTHAVIRRYTRLGAGNRVHPGAVLGGLPQDLGFDPASESGVIVGDGNTFREGVTVSRATRIGEATRIGSNGYFMNNSHVGHDCVVGDHNILAANVLLGGHVQVGERVFFGGGAVVHQFCRIGSYAMIRGMAGVNKDVLPYSLVGGAPIRHYRLNTVGLRRNGIEGAGYRALNDAFRRLRKRESLDDLPDTPELRLLRDWLAAPSKRSLAGFVAPGVKPEE